MNGAAGERRGGFLLWAILGAAVAVRLWGITFGLPHVRARPDELFILGSVVKMHAGQPNPGFFDYPGLYMYLVAGLYALYYGAGLVSGRFDGPEGFVANFYDHWEPYFIIPRVLGAVLGAATVAAVYALGTALLNRTAALLSALFMALAFLHVRDSHYATTDVPMTFFVVCAVLAAARVYRDGRSTDAWLAGTLAGCATSTKYNAVFVVLALASVEALRAWNRRSDWRAAIRDAQIHRMAAACLFVFAVTNPYLFLDHETALRDLRGLQASTSGGMTPPELLGPGWSYHLPNSLRHGLGLPLLGAGLMGIGWMAMRAPREALILGIFPVTYYAVVGLGHNVFVRYMVPVVPFVCLFAGFLVQALSVWMGGMVRGRVPAVACLMGLLVVAPSAWSVVQFDYLLAQEDNRLVGARWVHANIAPGSGIYTAGNLYGHMQLEERGKPPRYRYLDFDWRSNRFTERGRPADHPPDLIVVQRSGIVYSHVAPAVEQLLKREYDLVHVLRAADLSQPNFYDIQDGFYAAFGTYTGVRRFGPNYEFYRRRSGNGSGPT